VTNAAIATAISTIRAFLTEDFTTYRRLHAQLDNDERGAFALVLAASFREAANRRFGEQHSQADIIEFVAKTRAEYTRTGEAVTAEDAEKVIRAALGEEDLIDTMDGHAYGAAQTAMLFALTHEDNASRDSIDGLLADASEQAAGFFRRRGSQ